MTGTSTTTPRPASMSPTSTTTATPPVPPASAGPRQATDFLSTLFAPSDYIVLRPVETWTEPGGKRRSQVDYPAVQHVLFGSRDPSGAWRPSQNGFLGVKLARHIERANHMRTNLFFGVCPRVGGFGLYDLAWQIRTVPALWADLDDCSVDEAMQRCDKAGLPRPSIIVSSGNGVHSYWLLAEPCQIDDAGGDPPPVRTDWNDGKDGKKVAFRYIVDPATGEKLSLNAPQNIPSLSPKAQHIQDVLAGIAAKIDGDHTQDLARLLRLPGTLNRKNERNGATPKPCVMVECDGTRRYPFADFERFASDSPDKAQRERLGHVKLPAPRKLSPGRQDRFNGLVTACAVAPPGQRSEADFALCCYGVEHGQSAADVWAAVQNVGKFAEGGERYFHRTWAAAEAHTRKKLLANATTRATARATRKQSAGKAAGKGETPEGVSNGDLIETTG